MVQRGCPTIHRLSVNDVLLHQGTRSSTDNVPERCPGQEWDTVWNQLEIPDSRSKTGFPDTIAISDEKSQTGGTP